MQKDRLSKLARSIDALADKDEVLLRRNQEFGELRRKAALELYAVCERFVRSVNELISRTELRLDPPQYALESFQDSDVNLFQINVRGRILQIEFEATPELTSTEDFRIPYTLEGAVRCFNQELLQKDRIEEQLLFCTLEKSQYMWRFFETRTYRTGPFDEDYLISLLEQLV